jgi:hypothetical protein
VFYLAAWLCGLNRILANRPAPSLQNTIRELQDQIESTKLRIHHLLQRRGCLRQQRQLLQQRLCEHRSATVTAPAKAEFDAAGRVSWKRVILTEQPDVPGVPGASLEEQCEPCALVQHSAVSRLGAGQQQSETGGLPRGLGTFTYHCPISYADVLEHSPMAVSATLASNLSIGLKAYQSSIREHLQQPAADVCWFFRWPCSDFELCYSAGTNSPECSLACSLCFASASIEALFLVLEHEAARALTDPTYRAPQHPSLAALHVCEPPRPRAEDLKVFCVRTAIDGVCSLDVAVARVLQPILRDQRRRLPRTAWRRACVQCMNAMHISASGMAPPAGTTPPAALSWTTIGAAMHALLQQVICVIYDVFTESAPCMEVRSAPVATPGRLRSAMQTPQALCRVLWRSAEQWRRSASACRRLRATSRCTAA